MSTQKRRYELKARAEAQQATHDRIAAAASALHEEVGISNTTVADIARRAGVQRLTGRPERVEPHGRARDTDAVAEPRRQPVVDEDPKRLTHTGTSASRLSSSSVSTMRGCAASSAPSTARWGES